MAIEAPISKFKKNGLILYMVVCLAFAGWFAYDGYLNKGFIKEHTDEEGKADSTLVFNQKAPPFLAGGALLLAIYFVMIRGKRLIADENELIISGTEKIGYDSIEKIDKTHFDSKGFFIIGYRNANGNEAELKISNRKYDNLEAILNHLVEKISGGSA